ncbi:S8 family serine peptidase [Streptomyces sp. NPDC048305]|uniref:S8 family serine peptidase n=1 Tax=Streptomyces sp. NPDC048305 TaxID=3365532 RepID=UPI0037176C5F
MRPHAGQPPRPRPRSRRGRRPRVRGLLALTVAAALGVPLLGADPAVADPAPSPAAALRSKAPGALVQKLGKLGAQDETAFWVRLDSEADSSAARKAKSKTARDAAVVEARTEHAERTQAGLRSLIKKAGAHYESFWISNTLKVVGDKALAEKIAARPEVAAIEADTRVDLPDPLPGEQVPEAGGTEWNVDRIGAPEVWNDLGVRGEGVVVANIDTGVDYQHPTLLGGYRGLKDDGTFSHAYNWFDATASCPGDAPCDDHGHGTHTMGTMVGDDGAGNAIGVAPGATWIAAKACTTLGCPQAALLAAGQWILAPTDAKGQNPRPDLAPDVVNNSWGADIIDTWYKSMVQAWVDAGIFPAFSNGNDGPDCATAGSPGAYTNSYASGAFDSDGDIAVFSSRGSGEDGAVKPDIAAPGVDIRSAAPGGGYQIMSGTSMASPHTAATVALMWAVSPAIRGDIVATERLLDRTAHDAPDTTCGGTAENNNVFGEGRLDAYAAVAAAPRGPLGALSGTVTAEGEALAGATVELDGPMYASAESRADGTYELPKLMVGDYTVEVAKYGYTAARSTVTVTEGAEAEADLDLTVAPIGTVTGKVTTAGGPEAGATIAWPGAPAVTSAADGTFTLELPAGTHQLTVTPVSRCATTGAYSLQVAAGTSHRDILLPSRSDGFGTTCRLTEADETFPTGETRLNVNGPYSGAGRVSFPFPVALYGKTYREAVANVEGYLSFEQSVTVSANRTLPYTGYPNGSLYPFWDDLQLATGTGGIYWSQRGTAPHREIVVEWRDMVPSAARTQKVGFAVVIGEDGEYSYHYRTATGGTHAQGSSATIGAENAAGTDALLYSYNEPSLTDGTVLAFRPERSASVSGTVTDANDGKPLGGATVTVTKDGEEAATGSTGQDGTYLVQVPVTDEADYEVTVSAPHYTSHRRTAHLSARSTSRADTTLPTGLVTVTPGKPMTLAVPADSTRRRDVTVANTGSATDYTVQEAQGASWIRSSVRSGHLETGGDQQLRLTVDTTGVAPGTVLHGTVVIASDSGRAPEVKVPVTVVVPAYQAALDSGSDKAVTDASGDTWGPDRAWEAGAYGYVGKASPVSTRKTIEGTEEQALLGTALKGALEYRFDTVPDGVYQVELAFAELSRTEPGERVFDVMTEGTERTADLDIAAESGGPFTALTKTYTVRVTDGQLNLRLVAHTGKTLVNAVRVTHRPDLTG